MNHFDLSFPVATLVVTSMFACSMAQAKQNPSIQEEEFYSLRISPVATSRITVGKAHIQRLLFDENALTILGQKGAHEFFLLPKKVGKTTLYAVLTEGKTVGFSINAHEKARAKNFALNITLPHEPAIVNSSTPVKTIEPIVATDYVRYLQKAAQSYSNPQERDRFWQKKDTQKFLEVIPTHYQGIKTTLVDVYQNARLLAYSVAIENSGLTTQFFSPDLFVLKNVVASINVPTRLLPGHKAIITFFVTRTTTHD